MQTASHSVTLLNKMSQQTTALGNAFPAGFEFNPNVRAIASSAVFSACSANSLTVPIYNAVGITPGIVFVGVLGSVSSLGMH